MILMQCGPSPEEFLVQFTKSEVKKLQWAQDHCLEYIVQQKADFHKTQEEFNEAVEQINAKYERFSFQEKINYESKWKQRFHSDSAISLLNAKSLKLKDCYENLNQADKAQFNRLALEIMALQKNSKQVELLPNFFM